MELLVRKYFQYFFTKWKQYCILKKVAEKCHLLAYVLMILTLIPVIPTVRMIGFQKEKFMSLNLFITHTSGLHP
jgi:hypothetical protein